ncbi:sensor domain-containing diguanylate cyclase [Sphingomonas qomolangmaensis]|uniref:diguanylate cyclase n=1 Tax=Sphingomonas qomolangmaensis TaxID=2918765 RepID=A0ABY5L6K5_9SPHN|nr:diguanylate cyclase [Sphingomonas qomolangmaensis]UUL81527.1 diguanylate cyclase [Sphingomonas qomolangmaensis]
MVALGFFVATVGPIAFTRFGGGVACLWLATAVLGPYLASLPLRRWPVVMLLGALGDAVVTAIVGVGPVAAVPMGVVCAFESALFGWCLRARDTEGAATLASFGQVGTLIVASAGVSIISAFPGAAVAALATATPYWDNWLNWAAGHTLGAITLTPIMLLLLRGDAAAWLRDTDRAERIEAAFLGIMVSTVAILVFAQHALPLLFLPILPVMMATFRVGRIGAAISIAIVALVATVMTLRGDGPISLIDAPAAFRIQFLQFYLAVMVLTVLPAAADLRRRKEILDRLAISEARYRLVSENATDVVLTMDSTGIISYISPSVALFGGGYTAETMTGTNVVELIAPEDQARMREAYRTAIEQPGVTHMIEYRGLLAIDPQGVWLESRFRAVETRQGFDMVCAIRDISKRKLAEAELTRAASTDPLTGLGNRRIFNEAVDAFAASALLDPPAEGCVAIFDIDNFKAINDGFGHDAGDRMLRRFAAIAIDATRSDDLVARLGGEEFGILLPDTSPAQAGLVCDRLREAFASTVIHDDAGATIRATVSAGVAGISADQGREAAMRAADGALYQAKRTGRNRLVLAD